MNSLIVNSGSQTIMNLLVLVLILFGIGCLIKVIVDFSKSKVDIFTIGNKIKDKSISAYNGIKSKIEKRKERRFCKDNPNGEYLHRHSGRFHNVKIKENLGEDMRTIKDDSIPIRDKRKPKRRTYDDGFNSSTPYTDKYEKRKSKSAMQRSSSFGGAK